MIFESELIKTDVTAVKLINNRILAGIGSFLNIFDLDGSFVKKIRIFNGQKIHGIEAAQNNIILLHGGCYIQILECDFTSSVFTKLNNNKINDWILASRWLKDNFVALVVMKNKLLICDPNLCVVRQVACNESCILYSAFIAYNQINEIVILSGTVFGQVLVWKVNEENGDNSGVVAKLSGHNGVIFAVNYNKNVGYICSSSDDRSSILWFVEHKCLHKELKSSNPKITPYRKFYGHSSRIFRCLVLDDALLTAGEDSYVNVWNFEGQLLNKIATHQGGTVWAVDSDRNLVVSGGGGCGILLSHVKRESVCQRLTLPGGEVPRRIGLLHKNIVVITEKGALFRYCRLGGVWHKLGQHEDLKTYCILEVSKCRNLMSLSGYYGQIYIYQEQQNDILLRIAFKPPYQARIYSFHWLSCSTFCTCSNKGLLSLWYLQSDDIFLVTTFNLPEGKEMWTTSACQALNGRYIVGDRRGNIYMYELKTKSPIQTIRKAHNHLGITQLQNVGKRVVSMGRDGTIKTFFLDAEMELVSSDKVPFTWLTKAIGDWLLAFSGDTFVVWDCASRKALLEHPCGGGHRSWDFQKGETVTFTYIKERVLYVVTWEKKQINPINVVTDYHINIVNSMSVFSVAAGRYLLLSGSDDTNLRLSVVGKDFFQCIRTVKSHLSNVRTVWVHQLAKDRCLVFSGGGRGQIICWLLCLDANVEDSELQQEYSHYERSNEEEMLESEIRIMDLKTFKSEHGLQLLAACSDGNLNIFDVHEKCKLKLVRTLSYQTKCVTRIFILDRVSILGTMSTDGVLAFWDLSNHNTSPFKKMKVHQSAVIGCRFHSISQSLGLLVSGGDDGCIVASLLHIETNTVNVRLVDDFRDQFSHCAQVSGTWISERYFLTTGVDQKLLVFKWSIDEEVHLHCTFVCRYNSSVADIQGLECVEDEECFHAFLYGKGVEYVKITKRCLG